MSDHKRYALIDKAKNVVNIIVIGDAKKYKPEKDHTIQLLVDEIDKEHPHKSKFETHQFGKPLKKK